MFPGFTKLLNWYFSRSAAPYWVILFIDCLIVLISGIYVQLLNFGFTYTETHLEPLLVAYLQYFPCVLVGFPPVPYLCWNHSLFLFRGFAAYRFCVDMQYALCDCAA